MKRLPAALTIGILVVPLGATAQVPDDHADRGETASTGELESDQRARAEALFIEARELLMAGRTAEGRDLLREAIELYPTLNAALNLAMALRQTGQITESIELLGRVGAEEFGPLDEPRRTVFDRALAGAQRDLGRIRVRVSGVSEATVEVNGTPEGTVTNAAPLMVEVNPDEHVIAVSTADGQSMRRRVRVGRGERTDVGFELEPQPLEAEASNAIWWVLGTGAVAAIVAGIVIAVVANSQPDPEPVGDLFLTLR